MALFTISSNFLRVTAASHAAELQSICGIDGTEYLWQGDPAYWSERAPTLFPYIARLNQGSYYLDGQLYRMSIHGLAPYTDFSCTEHSDDTLILTMADTPDTLKQFPRRFLFSVRYHVSGNRLEVTYLVENRDERPMYFGVGGHPGFRVPLRAGLSFTDYRLRFSAPCRPKRVLFSDELLATGEETSYSLPDGQLLPLSHELFHEDAIVLRDMCREITLESEKDTHSVTVTFPDMPFLGLWHMPDTDAAYVCIEPWSSLPSRQQQITDLAAQPDLILLPPQRRYTNRWTITVK